jgi:hypothetical protein
MMRYFLIILFFVVALSCKKDNSLPEKLDLGYDYFPVKIGQSLIYDVDSIAYLQPSGDTIIKKFRIKESIESIYKDNQNRDTYKLVRYKKNYQVGVSYEQMNWILQDVWSVNLTSKTAEVYEENQRFIKLVFPVEKNISWNGNAQNNIGEWKYIYTEVHQALALNGLQYDSTLTVTQKKESTAIYYKNYTEQFAKGVGMIYKEVSDYKFKVVNGILFPGKISEGVIYKMKLVERQ